MPKTTKTSAGGKRYPLNMRTTQEIRDRLEEAANLSGRSMAQEVEVRLERSFAGERSLPELMALKFGPRLAALLFMIGETCRRTGIIADHRTLDALPSVGDEWTDHHHAYEYASRAASMLWRAARPKGKAPKLNDETRKQVDDLVSQFVGETINDIKNPDKPRVLRDAPLLRAFAGSLAERMTVPAELKDGGDNAR